ncbi:ParB-like nuclease domain-containing protein [Nocardioides scoriae]|uniref:ParB-like nuclease domain-containing protein n=1 Tax=Nocardioides scoriae TaxID=642780 RepID=A0A1H1LF10_9ACTN|nr:ParB/RepB/Spo0J family partition protein [Nocardioides scoriae]SDR73083.1 ParB-like nuclease domain-containing protein [Nocardioides scoriae]
MVRDTGSPRLDAENDFLRARRHQSLSKLAGWLRADADAAKESLSFSEVVAALGRRGERSLGVQLIPLEQIVGSVDKVRDFDRRFRPTSDRSRQRWEQISRKTREGHSFPPIDVYKLGNLYFVRDGHHRVSVARSLGATEIEALVTEIDTVVDTEGIGGRRDLDGKNWGLRFLKRVPLTGRRRAEITCSDPHDYHRLAEMVEAWAARLMHAEGAYFDKEEMARRWFDEEYSPVLEMIDSAGVRGPLETGADAYIRVAGERYRLIREHAWNNDVMDMIREQQQRARRRTTPGGAVRA